jgi:hypothetical protein
LKYNNNTTNLLSSVASSVELLLGPDVEENPNNNLLFGVFGGIEDITHSEIEELGSQSVVFFEGFIFLAEL